MCSVKKKKTLENLSLHFFAVLGTIFVFCAKDCHTDTNHRRVPPNQVQQEMKMEIKVLEERESIYRDGEKTLPQAEAEKG